MAGVRQYLTVVLVCISQKIRDVGHLFLCFGASVHLWRNFYLGFLPIYCFFFFLIFWWAICKFWEINPLSVALFANIFSHSERCLFILFIVFFAVQKLLSLTRSHLFIFVFITLGGGSENFLLWFMSTNVLPSVWLTFRSLIHFEFIFVYGVREYSNFLLLYAAVQFSQHRLLKRLSFLHCIFLLPLL